MELLLEATFLIFFSWIQSTTANPPQQPFLPNPFDHQLFQHFYSDGAPLVPDTESARLAAQPAMTGANISPLSGYETGQAQVQVGPPRRESTLSPEAQEANAEVGTEGGEGEAENQADGGQSKEAREAAQDAAEGDDDTNGQDGDNDNESSSSESSESEAENEAESTEGGQGAKYYGGRPGSAIPPHLIPIMGPLPEPTVVIQSAPFIMLPPTSGNLPPPPPLDRIVAHFPTDYQPPALLTAVSSEIPPSMVPHVPVGIVSPILQPHLIPLHKGGKINPENVDINIHQVVHNNYPPSTPVEAPPSQPPTAPQEPVVPQTNGNNSQPANLDVSAKLTEGPVQQGQPQPQQQAQGPQQSGYGNYGSSGSPRNFQGPSSQRLSAPEPAPVPAPEQAGVDPSAEPPGPVPNTPNERPSAYSSATPRKQPINQNQRQSNTNQEQVPPTNQNMRQSSRMSQGGAQPVNQNQRQPSGMNQDPMQRQQSANQQQQPQPRMLSPEELRRNQQISFEAAARDLAEALSMGNPGQSPAANARSVPAAWANLEALTRGNGQSDLAGNPPAESGSVDVMSGSKQTPATNPQEVGIKIFFKRSVGMEKEVKNGRKGTQYKSRFRNSTNGTMPMTLTPSSVQRLRKGKLHKPADIQRLQRKIASGYKTNSRNSQILSDDFP